MLFFDNDLSSVCALAHGHALMTAVASKVCDGKIKASTIAKLLPWLIGSISNCFNC